MRNLHSHSHKTMTRNFPTTSQLENFTFSQNWGRNHMQDHIRGFHNTPWGNTPMQNSDAVWLSEKKLIINQRLKASRNKTGIKCWCLRQANTMVWPVLGAREKQSGCISSVCVWCGRDSVCQIPFPLAKEKLPSPTHTPDVLPTSASWDTHTHLVFSSPRRSTHPRSCKLQDSKQIFPLPKMAVDRWPLLIRTWGESGRCCSSSPTRIPTDVRNGGPSKNLSEEAYGDPLHTAHKGSLVFGHTLNTVTCLIKEFLRGRKGMTCDLHKNTLVKVFWTWYSRYFKECFCIPWCMAQKQKYYSIYGNIKDHDIWILRYMTLDHKTKGPYLIS